MTLIATLGAGINHNVLLECRDYREIMTRSNNMAHYSVYTMISGRQLVGTIIRSNELMNFVALYNDPALKQPQRLGNK